MDTTTRHPGAGPTRPALVLAALAACFWAAKSVAIGTAGGLGRSPAEGPLFFLGLAASLLAAVCLMLVWARGRSRLVRVLAVLAGVPLVLLLATAVQGVVGLVEPADPAWPWAEVNLWVVAAAVLVVAVVVRRRTVRDAQVTRAPHTAG